MRHTSTRAGAYHIRDDFIIRGLFVLLAAEDELQRREDAAEIIWAFDLKDAVGRVAS